jgi:hypothetical protein
VVGVGLILVAIFSAFWRGAARSCRSVVRVATGGRIAVCVWRACAYSNDVIPGWTVVST